MNPPFLDNWGTISSGTTVWCCKVVSATFSSAFWQRTFIYFRNTFGLVYCAASNHTTAYIEFDMMWHIVQQLLRASDCITRFSKYFLKSFVPIHILSLCSKLGDLCAMLLELSVWNLRTRRSLYSTCLPFSDRKPAHLHKQCDGTS